MTKVKLLPSNVLSVADSPRAQSASAGRRGDDNRGALGDDDRLRHRIRRVRAGHRGVFQLATILKRVFSG